MRFSIATAAACVLALAAAGAAGSRPAAAPCTTAGLVVWIDTQGDGAAGSVYYKLKLTNQSGRTCTLAGFPGVSAIDLLGRQLGSPASRILSPAHSVTLTNGSTTSVVLRIVQVGNFPPATCRPVAAAGLRVYPPGQTSSKVVPFPFRACARSGPIFLSTGAVS